LFLRRIQRILNSKFSYRHKNKELLNMKVTGSQVRYANANICETVRDSDIVTMDNE